MGEDCFDNKIDRVEARGRDKGFDDSNLHEKVDTAVRKALDDVSDDISFLDCYGETITKREEDISKLPDDVLQQRRASLQSEFFSNNLMLSSSISRIVEKFERSVKDHLRPFPKRVKDQLIGVEVKLLSRIQPIVEKYLEKVRAFAKKIGVLNFSITVGTGLVSFSFTFGT